MCPLSLIIELLLLDIKFADNSVIVSLSSEHTTHGSVFDDFVTWCQDAFLKRNVL